MCNPDGGCGGIVKPQLSSISGILDAIFTGFPPLQSQQQASNLISLHSI